MRSLWTTTHVGALLWIVLVGRGLSLVYAAKGKRNEVRSNRIQRLSTMHVFIQTRPPCSFFFFFSTFLQDTCRKGLQRYRYVDKKSLIEYGLNRIKLSSSAVDTPDPTKVILSYHLAFFSPPPYCKLATIFDDFDFTVLVDLNGDVGWVDVTKHQEEAYQDRFQEIEDRREGWAFSDGSIMNSTFWLPNEPNPLDEGKIANAAVFDPGPPPGLASASAKSDQPGAYYICCYELRKDEIMGGNLDNVRGTVAEQLELAPTTTSPTSQPTREPTDEPTQAPTSAPTREPTGEPTQAPTSQPTRAPTSEPTSSPTSSPTQAPTSSPTSAPTASPQPSRGGSASPTPGCDFEPFQTDEDLRQAVADYLGGNETAKEIVVDTYGPIGNWCVFKVTDFSEVFKDKATFNEDIEDWDVSNAETMEFMFQGAAAFDKPLEAWDVSKATTMESMFQGAAAFDKPLEAWDVSKVTNMLRMFSGALVFNQPLEGCQVGNVKDMTFMFEAAALFDQPLNGWNVENVEEMAGMFSQASNFDQPLGDWNVSKVENMALLFNAAESFSHPVGNWDVSRVKRMELMFRTAPLFDHPLNEWDVSSVERMDQMFENAAIFNQNLNEWDVSSVTNMNEMFANATNFDQNLCPWGSKLTGRAVEATNVFDGSGCNITDDPDLEADVPGPLCVECTA